MSPPCESYLTADQLDRGETFYPLHVRVCDKCLLVQLPAYIPAEDIFSDYAYFSSYSDSWVAHAQPFVDTGRRRGSSLGRRTRSSSRWPATTATCCSTVVARGIRSLGIEPAANVAEAAGGRRVSRPRSCSSARRPAATSPRGTARPTLSSQQRLRPRARHRRLQQGPARAGGRHGTVSIEIPHLLRLIEGNEYDTIYHEHFSYLSLLTTQRVLAAAGLDGGRRRGAAHPRRLAADLVDADRAAPREPSDAGRRGARRGGRGRTRTRSRVTTGSPRQVATVRNDFVEFLVDCRGRASGRRLWRARARATRC